MKKRSMRILFNAWADENNVNAQNLNARDIALRLDPERFFIRLFCHKAPDPRLIGRKNISLIRLPGRLGSLIMFGHMIRGYDALFYLRMTRADALYRWFRLRHRDHKATIAPIESPVSVLDQEGYPPEVCRFYDGVMKVADRIVANSPYVAQTIRERYGLRVPFIYSGVDAEYFRRLALDRTAPRGKIRVLFAGSLQPRKHPELVIEAARHWPQADFILMGDGPLKPLLAQQVREEKLVNVSFQSTLAYREYARILVTADIFLFPSRIEGLGKVLMEAAASGIPALVFDDYCTPVIIDGVTGYQVKTFGEMLERLRWLMEDRELRIRMGRAAAEHANRFDWRIIAQQWEKVFEETIFEKAYDT